MTEPQSTFRAYYNFLSEQTTAGIFAMWYIKYAAHFYLAKRNVSTTSFWQWKRTLSLYSFVITRVPKMRDTFKPLLIKRHMRNFTNSIVYIRWLHPEDGGKALREPIAILLMTSIGSRRVHQPIHVCVSSDHRRSKTKHAPWPYLLLKLSRSAVVATVSGLSVIAASSETHKSPTSSHGAYWHF